MQEFFLQNVYAEYALRLILSLIFGFCLGFERKIRQHTVGIRTLILITTSSALLSILSAYMADSQIIKGDPTRITAAVITGIGFLGSGAIFRQGLNIRGLTSAAIIFCAAAIGLSCGAGLYIPSFITFAFALITLLVMGKFEHKLFPAEKRKLLKIEFSSMNVDEIKIREILKSFGLIIHDLDIQYSLETKSICLIYTIKTPDNTDSIKLADELSKLDNFLSLNLSRN